MPGRATTRRSSSTSAPRSCGAVSPARSRRRSKPLDADEGVDQLVREGFRSTSQIISVAEVMLPKGRSNRRSSTMTGFALLCPFRFRIPARASALRASDRRHVRGSPPRAPDVFRRSASAPPMVSVSSGTVPGRCARCVSPAAPSETPPARRRPRHRRGLRTTRPAARRSGAPGPAGRPGRGPGCPWPSGSPSASGAAGRPWRTSTRSRHSDWSRPSTTTTRPRPRLRGVRGADHHRRDQAALPRPHVDAARAAPGPGPAQPGPAVREGAGPDDPRAWPTVSEIAADAQLSEAEVRAGIGGPGVLHRAVAGRRDARHRRLRPGGRARRPRPRLRRGRRPGGRPALSGGAAGA